MRTAMIATLALLFVWPAASLAASSEIPHISVIGTAKTMVAPDQMNWSVNVKNKGLALKEVAARHTQVLNTVLALVEKCGVEKREIRTSRMRFGENWGYRNNSRFREGYFASTDISFKLSDFAQYGPLWMGLSQLQDVSVGGVRFALRDLTPYRNAERAKALLAAKHKAEAMAKVLGAQVGEPLIIADEPFPSPNPILARGRVAAMADADSASSEAQVAPGQIPVQVQVRVVFRLLYP